jgi:hypothetical protein
MITALLSGSNIKRDGSTREWDCVEYQGYYRKADDGVTLLRVKENGELKQINLDTFSGTIIDHDDELIFVNGQRVFKQAYCLPF